MDLKAPLMEMWALALMPMPKDAVVHGANCGISHSRHIG